MTGFLALFADPTASLQAATSNYVDNKFGTGVASFNNRTGVVSLALDDVTDVLIMLTSALELLQQHLLEMLPQLLRQGISLDHFQGM